MKNQWDKFWEQLEEMNFRLNSFLENSELSPIAMKQVKPVIKEWENLKKSATEIDKFISPTQEAKFKLPFEDEEFVKMWHRWKEYLSEQHGQIVRSRSELSALEHLKNISKNDVQRAVFILRFAMAGRYKNFFEVDEKTANEESKKSNKQSDFD